MSTILDLDQRAGLLQGYGAVSAEQVRFMVPAAGLRQVFVDAGTGVPLQVEDQVLAPLADPQAARDRLLSLLRPRSIAHDVEPRHDPSARLTRTVEVRDLRCIGIGCERQAGACEKDHEVRYPDGPTAYWNLSVKSGRCHRAKHAGWTVQRLEGGQVSWTSPLGHTYQRPGVWSPPPVLPRNLVLPPVRTHVHDDHDPDLNGPDTERPLLPTAEDRPVSGSTAITRQDPTPAAGANADNAAQDDEPRTWSDEPPF